MEDRTIAAELVDGEREKDHVAVDEVANMISSHRVKRPAEGLVLLPRQSLRVSKLVDVSRHWL